MKVMQVKILRFQSNLVPLVLSGEKVSTWRLFDDKNLSQDDALELRESGSDIVFATARITKVVEKSFRDLTDADKKGHESYLSDEEMYATYSNYYKTRVDKTTQVKIIWFTIL